MSIFWLRSPETTKLIKDLSNKKAALLEQLSNGSLFNYETNEKLVREAARKTGYVECLNEIERLINDYRDFEESENSREI